MRESYDKQTPCPAFAKTLVRTGLAKTAFAKKAAKARQAALYL